MSFYFFPEAFIDLIENLIYLYPWQFLHGFQGKLIDLKFCGGKLWILKGDGSMLFDLSQYDFET